MPLAWVEFVHFSGTNHGNAELVPENTGPFDFDQIPSCQLP